MKKDNIILVLLLIVIVIIALICGYFAYNKNEVNELTDAIKIKEEYEKYNGKINEETNEVYEEVLLSDDNPFLYKTEEDILKLLDNGTGLIYFGIPSKNLSRTVMNELNSLLKENNIKEIYYLDISLVRDIFTLDENDKIIKEKEGNTNYYKLLRILDKYLKEYTLIGSDNTPIPTKEKRIYAPTVISVLNGKITSFYEISSEKENDKLEEKELVELKKELKKLISSISTNDEKNKNK